MGRPTIEFESNEPVEVAVSFTEGKIVRGRFGDRVMYSLDFPAGHVMFLDLAVSQKINQIEVHPGEHFFICKRKKNVWDLWLSPQTEKARAAKEHPGAAWNTPRPAAAPVSDLERDLQASLDDINRRRDGANLVQRRPPAPETAAPGPVPVTMPAQTWKDRLVLKTDTLIDAYAACLEHANKHGNHVKPDDVRALLTTVYIAMTKNGASHAA